MPATENERGAAWDRAWMYLARASATMSPDSSRGVGCVIVTGNELLANAYNDLPHGVEPLASRCTPPAKYRWIEHAERNAIYLANRKGIVLKGSVMYCTLFPCMDCARGIVHVGVVELICPEPDWSDPKWGPDFAESSRLFNETGVCVRWWSEETG